MKSNDREALSIRLLGGFQVTVRGSAFDDADWASRKAAGLVKLLALSRGHILHREQVMAALWPQLGPDAAGSNLRKAIHFARRTLDPSSAPSTHPYIGTIGEMVLLKAPDELWVDVDAFRQAAALAHRSRDTRLYNQAIALYKGDLLPGDRYEEWTIAPRQELHDTYLSLLVDLAQLHEAADDHPPAIDAFQRVVAADPLHEEAQTALIRLYALDGKRHMALRQYNQYADVLKNELEAQPGAVAQELYKEILAGRYSMGTQPSTQTYRVSPRKHNLPAQFSSFIGRENEISEVRQLLKWMRLLTLRGPGGCGKTRLALEVASSLVDDYPDGVWLVELAALSDPLLVPQAVAVTLGVRDQPGRSMLDSLVEYLQPVNLLLVLDNCEHLVGECAQLVEALLHACSGLRILATSREALAIPGDMAWPVPPLSLPDLNDLPSAEELLRYEAVRLFVDRAEWALPGFKLTSNNVPAVARICCRLEGIPLALELAAARVKVLTVEQIVARLDQSFSILVAGSRTALPRHKTLNATIDWSYSLLSEKERALFRRLSVFAAGFTLEAAEAVCPGGNLKAPDLLDSLSHLIDKSLLTLIIPSQADPVSEAYYRMLETLRQYGRGRLAESGEMEETERGHALYYLALAERAELYQFSRQQVAWLERLDREHDNLRVALDWCQAHDVEAGLRIAGCLWWFWDVRGYHTEGRRRLDSLLAQSPAPAPTAARANALNCAGALALRQGDVAVAGPLLSECLAIFEQIGTGLGLGRALGRVGMMRYYVGDYAGSRELLQESLACFRQLGSLAGAAWTLAELSMLARLSGDYAWARELLEESLRYMRECGDRRGTAFTLNNLGQLMRVEGNHAQAWTLLKESLDAAREVGDKPYTGWALQCLGEVARQQGNFDEARTLLTEGLLILRDVGHERHISQALGALGVLEIEGGDYARGVSLISAATALHDQVRASLDADEKVAWDENIAAARAVLGKAAFEQAAAEGQSMTRNQAVEYVLASP